jgi:hypothetical protein
MERLALVPLQVFFLLTFLYHRELRHRSLPSELRSKGEID